ncbi:cytosol non-specific dipeptidase [Anaeramoeba flamelloides]|uniref:Cytosol non-specific dipeptidase n=1 Tax=Anaeramoeba flamelloides TaxID=1746091 RepID=A0AAV7ZFN7_9EUKA|nr:cytosol non-specific dipeptidase [Anaeramoeba flamelloides]
MEIKTKNNQKVLKSLGQPKNVFELFLGVCEIPHVSGNLDPIREALVKYGKKIKVETIVDEIGNVLFRKPATKGYEKKPSICIQGHMDMVGTKDEGLEFNFETDPISTKIEKGWLTAQGTTLGADNGIGVAMGLALLTENIKHGPLEVLLTVDEETSMVGAFNLKNDLLQSKYLINVDSEEDGRICIGSAGGFKCIIHQPITRMESLPEGVTQIQLKLHDLMGGHTGVQIHEGRANACKWMCRLLCSALETGFYISEFKAGHAKNAIPSTASVTLLVPDENIEQFKENIEKTHLNILEEFFVVEVNGVILDQIIDNQVTVESCLDKKSTVGILDMIQAIHHGVVRMSPDVEGLVESSQSLSICTLGETTFDSLVFARSSTKSQIVLLEKQLRSIATLTGSEFEKLAGEYPPWQPMVRNNYLLDTVKKVYYQTFKKKPDCYAIHAGLECSLIQSKYEGMIPISIGPQIESPHSTQERMEIRTVATSYQLLKNLIETMAK